jgi:hypothetical protein
MEDGMMEDAAMDGGDVEEGREQTRGGVGRRDCVSQRRFYCYHIWERKDPNGVVKVNPIIYARRGFLHWICDAWSSIDLTVLMWHKHNQSAIRSDLYSGVVDALATDHDNPNPGTNGGGEAGTAAAFGRPTILNASYTGGDRFLARTYQVRLIPLRGILQLT